MIRTECACGREIRTKDSNAGKVVNCPECGEQLRLPGRRPRQAPKQSASLPGRRGGRTKPRGDGADKDKPRPQQAESGDGPDKATKYLLIFGGVMGVAVIAGAIAWVVGAAEAQEAAKELPKEFAVLNFEQGGFSCEYPKEWDMTYGGGTGGKPPYAKFKDEDTDVRVEIRAAVSGSIVSDMVGTHTPDGKEIDPIERLKAVHLFRQQQLDAGTDGYTESDLELVETKGLGPAMLAKYRMSVLISTDYGYRATVIGSAHQYNVTLFCDKGDEEHYKPLFVRIVKSMDG